MATWFGARARAPLSRAGPALRNSLDTNFSYTEYLESTGIKVSKKVTRCPDRRRQRRARRPTSTSPPDAELVEVRRVRIAGNKPAIYSIDSLPADIVDPTRDRKAFSQSLYRLLAVARPRRRPRPHHLTPVIATPESPRYSTSPTERRCSI